MTELPNVGQNVRRDASSRQNVAPAVRAGTARRPLYGSTEPGSYYDRQRGLPVEVGQLWEDLARGSSWWQIESVRMAIVPRYTLKCLANGARRETTGLGVRRDYRKLRELPRKKA